VAVEHYENGVRAAIEDSDAWLKKAYDDAVKKYGDEYEPVLWSVADHWETERSTDQMYPSYENICVQLGRPPVSRTDYSQCLNRLKTEAHGQALIMTRRSWFKFRHSMLRGYCKMLAESRDVHLGLKYLETRKGSLAAVHGTSSGVPRLPPKDPSVQ
jgi:hypothetical protein